MNSNVVEISDAKNDDDHGEHDDDEHDEQHRDATLVECFERSDGNYSISEHYECKAGKEYNASSGE